MRPACNLESRGRVLRLASGVVMTAVALALMAFWAWPSGRGWPWTVSLFTLSFGLFQMYEAWAGWCVVRAMGFKTPI